MTKIKFCTGVIWYNPDKNAVKRIKILSEVFEKVFVYDNSENSNYNKVAQFDNVQYLFNGKNEGISIAFNKIARLAEKFDFLFALDQDTEIKGYQIMKLKEYIEKYFDPQIGIYCPNIYFKEKKSYKEEVSVVPFTITSCSMLSLKIFRQISGYDEKIFLDGVDWDYCIRLRIAGYFIKRINSIEVKQNLGFGFKNLFGIYEHSAARNYYIRYNRLYLINKFPDYFYGWKKIKHLYLANVKQVLSVIFFEKDKMMKLKMIKKANKDYECSTEK